MLLRGIAFAEARRSSARRVFKCRDKAQQGAGCEKDAADVAHDESQPRHALKAMMVYRAPEEPPLSPVFPIPFVSCAKRIFFSLSLVAPKLARREDGRTKSSYVLVARLHRAKGHRLFVGSFLPRIN